MLPRALAWAFSASVILSSLTVAQTPAPKRPPQPQKAPAAPAATPPALGSQDEGRRMIAVSLLTSLGHEAANFRDQRLRVRVQARVANALWAADAEAARGLFRRAWGAAEAADAESARRAAEESSAATKNGQAASPSNLRGEVMRLAAARDAGLAEEFLSQLVPAGEQKTSDAPAPAPAPICPGLLEGTPAEVARLDLAKQLLQGGEAERALPLAEPALGRATTRAVSFLSQLRSESPAAADARYAAALKRAGTDPCADANTVLILSSYVFTPNFFVTLSRGLNTFRYSGPVSAPDSKSDAHLRRAFFLTAAQILSRPAPSAAPDDADRAPTLYFAINRLLPLFQQHAPDLVDGLREQLNALASAPISKQFRSARARNLLTAGLVPEETADELQAHLDLLSYTNNSAESDVIRAKAAQLAAIKGDERAAELASGIEDRDLRKQVRAYVDFLAVGRAVKKKDAETVIGLARGSNLTDVQRVWALTEAAHLLKKEDGARAAQVLEEALATARRLDEANPHRVHALLGITTRFYEVERARAWELVGEVVRAAGKAADFSGENGEIGARMQAGTVNSATSFSVPSFDLAGIFALLARDNMSMAISAAQGFSAEAPRSLALLSIARSALGEERKPAAARKAAH